MLKIHVHGGGKGIAWCKGDFKRYVLLRAHHTEASLFYCHFSQPVRAGGSLNLTQLCAAMA